MSIPARIGPLRSSMAPAGNVTWEILGADTPVRPGLLMRMFPCLLGAVLPPGAVMPYNPI